MRLFQFVWWFSCLIGTINPLLYKKYCTRSKVASEYFCSKPTRPLLDRWTACMNIWPLSSNPDYCILFIGCFEHTCVSTISKNLSKMLPLWMILLVLLSWCCTEDLVPYWTFGFFNCSKDITALPLANCLHVAYWLDEAIYSPSSWMGRDPGDPYLRALWEYNHNATANIFNNAVYRQGSGQLMMGNNGWLASDTHTSSEFSLKCHISVVKRLSFFSHSL